MDFCSWFLLRSREGYCTYFATALTLLCRMEGIPARYVTGFTADAGEESIVRARDAHAWCEIYLNGFGWLTLDATPAQNESGDGAQGDQPVEQPPAPTPTPPLQAEAPTPSPASASAPTPSPEPEAEDSPDPTPAPSAVPPKTEEDTAQQPEAAGEKEEESHFPWIVLPLLLLLLIALAWFVWRRLRPEALAERYPSRQNEILCLSLLCTLEVLGFKRARNETVRGLLWRAKAHPLLKNADIRAVSLEMERALYAQKEGFARVPAATHELQKDLLSSLPVQKRMRFVTCWLHTVKCKKPHKNSM